MLILYLKAQASISYNNKFFIGSYNNKLIFIYQLECVISLFKF